MVKKADVVEEVVEVTEVPEEIVGEEFAQADFLDQYSVDIDDMEGIDIDKTELIRVEKIQLMQPTSLEVTAGEVSKAGVFYNPTTKEEFQSIKFFPIYLGKSRVMWPENFKRGDKPLCRSKDGKRNIDGTIKCDTCPHSQWKNDKENARPDCNSSTVIFGIIYDPDNAETDIMRTFRITATGSSIGSVNAFGGKLLKRKLPIFINGKEVKRSFPLYFNLVEMKSRFEKNDKGAFFVLEFTDSKEWSDIPTLLLNGQDPRKLTPQQMAKVNKGIAETAEAFKVESETTIQAYRQDNPDYNDDQLEAPPAMQQLPEHTEKEFKAPEENQDGALGSF